MNMLEEVPSTYVGESVTTARSQHVERQAPRQGWTEPAPPDPVTERSNKNEPAKTVRRGQPIRQPSLPTNLDVTVTAIDETRSTDDSSSQTSATRRTGDMSTHFRQRIRQQAKQMVEQKRGSAQLARRLQRTRSLQTHSGATGQLSALDVEDDAQIDKRIEDSIKLGQKYTRNVHSLVPPERIQRQFFFDEDEHNYDVDDHIAAMRTSRAATTKMLASQDADTTEITTTTPANGVTQPSVVHARPRFPTKSGVNLFRSLLINSGEAPMFGSVAGEEAQLRPSQLRDPLFDTVPTLFAVRPQRDVSSMMRHMGQNFLVNEGRNLLGFEEMTTDRPVRLIHAGTDDDIGAIFHENNPEYDIGYEELVTYRRAVNFDDDASRANLHGPLERFSRLDIDVNRIEFEHHWLYTAEDAAARALRTVFERYSAHVDTLIDLIRDYMVARQEQSLVAGGSSNNDAEQSPSKLASILSHIDIQKRALISLSEAVEAAWKHLQRVRTDAQARPITRVTLRKSDYTNTAVKLYLEKNEEVPESFQEIMHLSSFTLEEDTEAPKPPAKVTQERLAALRKCRLQIEIYFNEILVCTTDEAPLVVDAWGGFSAIFGRVYRLQVTEPPREICMRILERYGTCMKNWQELARVYVPPSNDEEAPVQRADEAVNTKSETSQPGGKRRHSAVSLASAAAGSDTGESVLHAAQFASELLRDKDKSRMGCGDGAPFMSGTLYYSSTWQNPDRAAKTVNRLSKLPSREEFALIPEAAALCTEEEFQTEFSRQLDAKNRRGAPSPAFTRQLSSKSRSGTSVNEFFSGMDDFSALLGTSFTSGSSGSELSLDAYRRVGHAYAVLIRRHLVENLALEQRLKTYSEIVHEESLPVLFRTFGTLFTPPDLSRKLKPMRLPSTATRAQQTIRGTYRLVVNVQSANNLAERISGEPSHVFAEVSFQKSRARTTVVEGRHANWQETITLELDADACMAGSYHGQNTFEPRAVVDSIQLDLFDQIVTPFEMDDREPNTFHEQVENVWLGSSQIPFSTIYSMGKVDGTMTLNRPLFTAGYKVPEQRRHASIKLMVAIDPPLIAPQFTSYKSFERGESEERLYNKAKKWETRMSATFPDRRITALANDSNGKRVIASRFLSKILPPSNIALLAETNINVAASACIDLVASIPPVEDAVLFPGVCDVWTNAFEMLKVGCGTSDEKAILLACWLMGLNLNASLVLGSALPEGLRAAYVLLNLEQSTTLLINATNANCYTLDDPNIPLCVGTIVTPYNVYANIQRGIHPSLIDFDLKKNALWSPLFSSGRSDLISVQTDTIRYVNASEDLLAELRATLEREIKLHFDEARQYGIPQWNLLASRTLRDILQELWNTDLFLSEERQSGLSYPRMSNGKPLLNTHFNGTVDVESRLNGLRSSYKINASVFCCAYTSKNNIIERVMKLRAHLHANMPHIQHALAVHVHPFVNQLVAISVALAVLTPHSSISMPPSATPWAAIGTPSFFPSQSKETET